MRKLHGDSPEDQESADREFVEMRETIKAEKLVRSRSLSDLWATRGMLRRTLVAVGVQVFGQFSGINVINYFGPSMYKALGLSAGQSLLVQGIYGAVGPITNFLCVSKSVLRMVRMCTDGRALASSRSSSTRSAGRSLSCSEQAASS